MQRMINMFMNMIKCVAFVWPLSFTCFAQTLPDIQSKFKSYAENHLQEKLFVHTDRRDYLAGELIWFKVYSVDGFYNKPLDLSKVAYVDVLDNQQNPVLQAKIALNAGSGSGSLFIPVSVRSGNYKLRAYTSWMKNFSPEFYFEKVITIVNAQVIPDIPPKPNTGFDIQFFPEGGHLVAGIKSKVAFKAVGADGMGINCSGAIIDQKNDTIVRFSPVKFGMGSFMFTPAKGDTYSAVVRAANDHSVTKSLPAIAHDGYVMNLTENSPGQLDVEVSSTIPTGNVYIFLHTRQILKLVKEARLENNVAHFTIDKRLLGEGISHITIFNNDRQPVCERLYFKRPVGKLFLDARPDQAEYAGRKKVSVEVQAKDGSGNQQSANLSMSVYRVDAFQKADSSDILNYFWLSADLQGHVESPEYYFSGAGKVADEAADNLMLTQGWRSFKWENILSSQSPAFSFLPETYGHLVTGKMVNAATNLPASGIVAYLAVPGKKVQVFASKSDSLGRLLFNTKDMYGDEIVVQSNPQVDSTYRIDILKPFSEQYSKNRLPLLNINAGMQEAIEKQNLGMQVQNIYSGNKLRQLFEPVSDSSGFYEQPANTYKLDDYTRFTTMEEVLREYVREVNVFREQKHFHLKVAGENGFLVGDPLVLVDDVPIFDMDKVIAINPLLIQKLAIVPRAYFYGPARLQGILSFTSYKGDQGGVEIDPHALVVDYEGLQMQRVFYSPVYETDAQIRNHMPDFRNLLYWSPSVKANGGPVSFYTSDQVGKYIGVVQGITADGQAGSTYFSFEVKK